MSIAGGVLAAGFLLAGCGGPACRTTNLVIDFPQPIPEGTAIHVKVNDQTFDVTCPVQLQPPNFAQIANCTDQQLVLYFDLMVAAAVQTVTVWADLPDGTRLFGPAPTSLGTPAMNDPVGHSGLCDLPVSVLGAGHSPSATPAPGWEACAGGATVAAFDYGDGGPATITALQVADGSAFMGVNHAGQGAYDVASVALPCAPPAILASAKGTIIGGPIVAAGSVFWATTDGVLTVPVLGGPAQVAAPGPLMEPVFFAATTTALVWIDFAGTVQRLDLSGGPAMPVAASRGVGGGIAASDTTIYFSVVGNADWSAGAGFGQGGAVFAVPVTGGDVLTIAAAQQAPRDLVVSATDLYWASAGTHSGDFPAMSAGNADGLIVRQPLAGGPPLVLATGEANPTNLHLLDAAPLYPVLYWTDGGLGDGYAGREMAAAWGPPATVTGGSGLAFDADRVYWWQPVFTGGAGLFSAVVLSAPR